MLYICTYASPFRHASLFPSTNLCILQTNSEQVDLLPQQVDDFTQSQANIQYGNQDGLAINPMPQQLKHNEVDHSSQHQPDLQCDDQDLEATTVVPDPLILNEVIIYGFMDIVIF